MSDDKNPTPLIPSYKVRHDGWTHARTKTFLATLRQTGCVADAARVVGKETVIIRKGEEVERRISPDSSILALLLKHGDMGGSGAQRIGNRTADKVITIEEWQEGMRFDDDGRKVDEEAVREEDRDIRERLDARLRQMRERLSASGARWINIVNGEGITPEVINAVLRFTRKLPPPDGG